MRYIAVSHVKEHAKTLGLRVSPSFYEALSRKVETFIDKAAGIAKQERVKTLSGVHVELDSKLAALNVAAHKHKTF